MPTFPDALAPMQIQWVGLTHAGRVRDHNEDNFFLAPNDGIGFVADGMGGHECGEVASALATQVVARALGDGNALADCLVLAHRAILAHPLGGGSRGMGTTGVLLRIHGPAIEVAWVGDSRAYLFQDGRLLPLTRDHTPVQEMVDRGLLDDQQARVHPRRNQVSQALGVSAHANRVLPGLQHARWGVGDIVMLCSDGLTEHLDDGQIQALLAQGTRDLEEAGKRLVSAALKDGGTDNITVVLAKAVAG